MEFPEEQGEMRKQLKLTAQALEQISENPEVFSEMMEAINSLDQKRFSLAIDKAKLPPGLTDACITMVETMTAFIPAKQIEYKKVCRRKGDGIMKESFIEAATASLNARSTDRLLEALEAAGLIVCELVKVIKNGQIITATISKTICPGHPEPG
jgi:hypothetical protein